MPGITVKTGLDFSDRPIAQLFLPEKADSGWVDAAAQALQKQGLVANPGIIEGKHQYILRISGPGRETRPEFSEKELRSSITEALSGELLEFKGISEPEPVTHSSPIAKWMYENARWAYDRAGAITGGLFFAGASGLMYSAFNPPKKDGEESANGKREVNWIKAASALFLMTSSVIIGLFVRQPKDPRNIHAILHQVGAEKNMLTGPQVDEDIARKDGLGTRINENLRRFSWETASIINVPANLLFTASTLTKANREANGAWWQQTAIGLTNLGNMLVRMVMPQNGGQSVLSRLPATRKLAEKLYVDAGDSESALRKNPINVTANVALGTKVAGMAVGIRGGKKDLGFFAMNAAELAGIGVSKATSKAVGIGFDETVTMAAEFIERWDDPAVERDKKITWLAKKLAKQPEIFHLEEDLAEGIRRRLEFRQPSATDSSPSPEVAETRYTKLEKRVWAGKGPFASRHQPRPNVQEIVAEGENAPRATGSVSR